MLDKKSLINYLKNQEHSINTPIGMLHISNLLGEGGNGVVYNCALKSNLNFTKKLAIKFLLNNQTSKLNRFLADYLNIISLKSQYIPTYYYYGCIKVEELDYYYIVSIVQPSGL